MKSVYFLKIPGIYIWSMYSSDKTKTVIRIFKDYDMNIVFRDCQMLFNPPPKCGEGIIGQSTLAGVRAISYLCIDGLPSNLLQMLSSMRRCAMTLTWIHTSKVKVTQILTACYFIDVTNQWPIFLLFSEKITLTLILPTLHTIWITLTNILL